MHWQVHRRELHPDALVEFADADSTRPQLQPQAHSGIKPVYELPADGANLSLLPCALPSFSVRQRCRFCVPLSPPLLASS